MTMVCPSITAPDKEKYHQQMEKIASYAKRIQIDLTDGIFANGADVEPEDAWWPVGIMADFHLMYEQPDKAIDTVLEHKPNLVIVHSESKGNFLSISKKLRELGVMAGVALLPKTSADSIVAALDTIDHVLIFSGDLGKFGGHANFDLLKKVEFLKQHKPSLEIGWDGGINDQNISRLAAGGVDVFNVGGFIQHSANPEHTYKTLTRIAEETGTT
jgi:ribulose-phosphate 3-epimerase